MKPQTIRLKYLLISASQILSLIYVLPTIVFAELTRTTLLPSLGPVKVRGETVALVLLAILYLVFPVWVEKRKRHGNLPDWAKFVIVFLASSPVIFYLTIVYLPESVFFTSTVW